MESALQMIHQLQEAGEAGLTAAELRQHGGPGSDGILETLISQGEVSRPRASGRFYTKQYAPNTLRIREKVRRLFQREPDRLRSHAWLARQLAADERLFQQEVLDALLSAGELVAYWYGNRQLFAWLPVASALEEISATALPELQRAWQRLAAEQGGFPDVPLADLRRTLGWPLPKLHATVHEAMKTGVATLRRASTAGLPPDWLEAAIRLPGEAEPMVKLEWRHPL